MGGWTRRRALAAAMTGAGLVLGLASVSAQSFAVMSDPDAATGGDLVVEAQPRPTAFFDMSPGESRYWSIDAALAGADRGSLALRVFGAGALIEHPRHPLTIAIEGCDGTLVGDDPRERPICAGAAYTPIIEKQPLAEISSHPERDQADDVWALPDIVRGQARSFVVTLALPAGGADDKTLMGLRGEVGVGLFAAGEDAAAPPPAPTEGNVLATTGAALPLSLLLIAAGTIGLGSVLRRVRGSAAAPGRSS